MNYTEEEIIIIAEKYKKQFSLKNKIVSARFYSKVNNGENYWIVTGEFEQFGEIENFFYMISDKTTELIQTMNEHGVNPHLDKR